MSVHGNGAAPGFDAIVVGAGHNGLTAAAYLRRAGLRTCVVEARDVIGGACVTEEVRAGQRVSRASYVVSMLQPKVVADLELSRFERRRRRLGGPVHARHRIQPPAPRARRGRRRAGRLGPRPRRDGRDLAGHRRQRPRCRRGHPHRRAGRFDRRRGRPRHRR